MRRVHLSRPACLRMTQILTVFLFKPSACSHVTGQLPSLRGCHPNQTKGWPAGQWKCGDGLGPLHQGISSLLGRTYRDVLPVSHATSLLFPTPSSDASRPLLTAAKTTNKDRPDVKRCHHGGEPQDLRRPRRLRQPRKPSMAKSS